MPHYSDLMQWGMYLLSVPASSNVNKIHIKYEHKQLSQYSVSTTEIQILTGAEILSSPLHVDWLQGRQASFPVYIWDLGLVYKIVCTSRQTVRSLSLVFRGHLGR